MGACGWAVVLACLSGALAAESFLNNFGRTLHSELSDLLEMVEVDYYEAVIVANYTSREDFDMRAMGPLYNSSKYIIDFIVNKQAYPEGIVSVEDGHINIAQPLTDHWRELLAHYAGPVSFLTVALLLAAALPLAGLFWCCCQWCRSNRRRRPFDRKYDACLKALFAIMLIALLTLFLMGVVSAFVTEEQLEQSVDGAPAALRGGGADLREYLNATAAHARWILVVNYKQLEAKLQALLDSSGMKISVQLGEFSRAVSVTSLNRMVLKLDDVKDALAQVQKLTLSLRTNADRLNTGLRKVKGSLLSTLARCDQAQCRKLQDKYKINQLDTDINYSQIPDVSPLLWNVSALLASDIQADVARGQKVFSELQAAVRRSLTTHLPQAHQALRDVGVRLEAVSDSITETANGASSWLGEQTPAAAAAATRVHKEYGPPRRAAALAASCLLLTISVLVCVGVTCGVCGRRPDAYGSADCCNKGAARKCLLCGSCVMLLGGGALCAVLAVYFVVGVAAQRFVCDPLTTPADNRLFSDLEQFIDLERVLYNERSADPITLEKVLDRCSRNLTIYETLELHRKFDLDSLKEELESQVDLRVSSLRATVPNHKVVILSPSAQDKLRRMADTGLADFDYDKILDSLETNITSLSLDALSSQLRAAAGELARRPGFTRVSVELGDAAALLADYHQGIVMPMTRDTAELHRLAVNLRDSLRFNHTSLPAAVSYLLEECAAAETFLNTRASDLVHNLTAEFASVVKSSLSSYLSFVVTSAREEVGACAPAAAALRAATSALCTNIALPLNGYWMSLSWCVLLFVPLLVVMSRLARLYAHLDPYPGPLVEAEYLYDAYADRDNVPLANAYKAEKRGVGGSGRARAAAAAEEPAPAPRAEPHARRYNDMAPKHWEEGPPRYHTPTEYERPPPYYYPGPADRQ